MGLADGAADRALLGAGLICVACAARPRGVASHPLYAPGAAPALADRAPPDRDPHVGDASIPTPLIAVLCLGAVVLCRAEPQAQLAWHRVHSPSERPSAAARSTRQSAPVVVAVALGPRGRSSSTAGGVALSLRGRRGRGRCFSSLWPVVGATRRLASATRSSRTSIRPGYMLDHQPPSFFVSFPLPDIVTAPVPRGVPERAPAEYPCRASGATGRRDAQRLADLRAPTRAFFASTQSVLGVRRRRPRPRRADRVSAGSALRRATSRDGIAARMSSWRRLRSSRSCSAGRAFVVNARPLPADSTEIRSRRPTCSSSPRPLFAVGGRRGGRRSHSGSAVGRWFRARGQFACGAHSTLPAMPGISPLRIQLTPTNPDGNRRWWACPRRARRRPARDPARHARVLRPCAARAAGLPLPAAQRRLVRVLLRDARVHRLDRAGQRAAPRPRASSSSSARSSSPCGSGAAALRRAASSRSCFLPLRLARARRCRSTRCTRRAPRCSAGRSSGRSR